MSGQADLRTFLKSLRAEKPDSFMAISQPVPRDYVSTALAMEMEKRGLEKVLHFESVQGYEQSLAASVMGSIEFMAHSVGKSYEEFKPFLADCLDDLLPAKQTDDMPVQEIVLKGDEADLNKLPIPIHFAEDAGQYITAGMVAANDPETGVGNLAYARLQVKGPRIMGVSLHSRQHLWDYHRRAAALGKDLPCAVVIGAHPAVMVAAAAKLGSGQDEYDLAGALMGEPLLVGKAKTVDVMVPAYAEIVIEGHILAEEHIDEGPFGEYTGNLTGRSTNNVFQVSAITMRKKAIYTDIIPGNSNEHLVLGRIAKEAWVHKRMKEALPFFIDFHYPNSGTHFHCFVRIEKHGEGFAKQAAELLLGLDHYVKLVVVVDKDIDVRCESEVMWAMATRMQADRDVSIISNVMCNQLDPSSHNGVGAKMIIDATKPLDDDSKPVSIPDHAARKAKELIALAEGETGG